MLAKFGLVLLTLVFGAFAFGAGILAPASLRQGIGAAGQQAKTTLAALTGIAASPASGASGPASASASLPSAASSTAPPSPAASAASAPAPVPAASLLLPTQSAASTSYALQAAQFSIGTPASQLAASIQAQGVSSTVVLMTEPGGATWSVVTAGQFGSADEAFSQRNYVAAKLGLPGNPRVIALPPPAKLP